LDREFAGRLAALLGLIVLALPSDARGWDPSSLFAPCRGDCGVAVYAGRYVEDSLTDTVLSPSLPTDWDFGDDDHLVATAVSRQVLHFGRGWILEPEVGIGQRFGRQSATEVWGALFLRYRGFPWDGFVVTTAALSTGLNWASEVTDQERDRARDEEGDNLMHYLAPEITLAAPSRPDLELVLRFHHRSGVWGIVSDAWGGAQYASVGLRLRF
jgi:hypothetical protein